jgi:hypothetical protein
MDDTIIKAEIGEMIHRYIERIMKLAIKQNKCIRTYHH